MDCNYFDNETMNDNFDIFPFQVVFSHSFEFVVATLLLYS